MSQILHTKTVELGKGWHTQILEMMQTLAPVLRQAEQTRIAHLIADYYALPEPEVLKLIEEKQ